MLHTDEGGSDVFFDSVDCFSPECGSNRIEYDIWMNEPRSVEERRAGFLRVMDLSEYSSSSSICTRETKMMMGLEKQKDFSGLVSENFTMLSYNASENQAARETNIPCEEFRKDGNEDIADLASQPESHEPSTCSSEERHTNAEVQEESQTFSIGKKKLRNLWRHFVNKKQGDMATSVLEKPTADAKMTSRIKVKRKNKKLMELTAVYMGQEIKAHKGLIWTMKFSPDGQYLASGGEDGALRVWRVSSLDASIKLSTAANKFLSNVKEVTLGSLKKGSSHSPVVLPKKVFHIEELPIHEFYGHSSGILDLAWSESNLIISASKDKTVRLWQVGCDECLNVFHHTDYVTCLQFDPVDENYFVSGSLDGKIRIWGVSKKRVVDWADMGEGITAISYQPDGNGFLVGSLTGCCRFYVASGQHIQLGAQMYVQGKRKSSRNRITGIQFSRENCQRAMVASEYSKICILDGTDVLRKYRGLVKSGSQMSASCTSTGKHIISVGEDSRVYMWNLGDSDLSSRRPNKSVRSCEYFFSEGVTVAVPWSGLSKDWTLNSPEMKQCIDGTLTRNSETSSLSSWFPIDSSTCLGSMTWPEERLPFYDVPVMADKFESCDHYHQCKQPSLGDIHHWASFSETWGLVIVTADSNGSIKTFHNFGLPIQV